MRRMTSLSLSLAAMLASVAVVLPARAQDRSGTTEITLFGGGYFGGTLYNGSNALFSRDVRVATVGTYGIRIGGNVTRWFGIEAGYARAEPDLQGTGSGTGLFGTRQKLGTLELNQFDLNGVFNMGRRRVIPYITLGAGATTLKATTTATPTAPSVSTSTDTRFAANLGGGVKAFFTPHVAMRLDARYRAVYVNDSARCSDSIYCDGTHYRDDDRRRWLSAGEVTGGILFAF